MGFKVGKWDVLGICYEAVWGDGLVF